MLAGKPPTEETHVMYRFEPYDVLQSRNGPPGREWLDFMTLRTQQESADAWRLVNAGEWEGKPLAFRIVRPGGWHGPWAVVCARDDG